MSNTSDRLSPAVLVGEFHARFRLPARRFPVERISDAEVDLRRRLLAEEFGEYLAAIHTGDVVDVADALADMVYVIYGTALHYGIDLDDVLAEVHRSNMTKTGHDGGKAVKGAGYRPPDIAGIIRAQRDEHPGENRRPAENPANEPETIELETVEQETAT